MPMLIALTLVVSSPGGRCPALIGGLGLAIGLQMILAGVVGIHMQRKTGLPSVFNPLISDGFFPVFLFTMQTALTLLAVALLWRTLRNVGIHLPAWQNGIVATLVLMIPFTRLANELVRSGGMIFAPLLLDLCRYASINLVIILIAFAILEPTDQNQIPAVTIWACVTLCVMICLFLLIDHGIRLRKESLTHPPV